jgi:hypothetical protein
VWRQLKQKPKSSIDLQLCTLQTPTVSLVQTGRLVQTGLLVLLFTLGAVAEEAPEFEVCAGYSVSNAAAVRHTCFRPRFNLKLNIRESIAPCASSEACTACVSRE